MASSNPRAGRQTRVPATGYPYVIRSLSVEDLFGKYSYPSLQMGGNGPTESNISVLIGDNGTGKTTLLRLIYASLSPEPSAGLRSIVARTPFRRLSITLADATIIEISKVDLVGAFTVTITEGTARAVYEIEVDADGSVYQHEAAENLERHLSTFSLDLLFVDHTRSVRSTYSFLSELSLETAKREVRGRKIRIAGGGVQYKEVQTPAQSEFPLTTIVNAVNDWFRVRAFNQGATGEQDASIVYLQVIKTLAGRKRGEANTQQSKDELLDQIAGLAEATAPFVRQGLLSAYPFAELSETVLSVSRGRFGQVQAVLAPFLGSIQKRMAALKDTQELISTFEGELNKYFKDKQVHFYVLDGLAIEDDKGRLPLEALSSGEKQLVFLLCSSLLSRDGRSLILIDEPELSLNYRWQRMIASSLAKLTARANTQFILASHSIEIISRYVDSSIELK